MNRKQFSCKIFLRKFVQCTKIKNGTMEIKRDSYHEQLKIEKDNGMIKIITGIRRCGKSFLLFVLFKKYLLDNSIDNGQTVSERGAKNALKI